MKLLEIIKNYFYKKRIRLSKNLFAEAFIKNRDIMIDANNISILALGSSVCARSFDTSKTGGGII